MSTILQTSSTDDAASKKQAISAIASTIPTALLGQVLEQVVTYKIKSHLSVANQTSSPAGHKQQGAVNEQQQLLDDKSTGESNKKELNGTETTGGKESLKGNGTNAQVGKQQTVGAAAGVKGTNNEAGGIKTNTEGAIVG